MSPGPAPLDAWVVPPGTPQPPEIRGFETRVGTVRYPGPDPEWLAALAASLREAADELRDRPVERVVEALGMVGERLLDPADPTRGEALRFLPVTSGLSPEMSAAVLDVGCGRWGRR